MSTAFPSSSPEQESGASPSIHAQDNNILSEICVDSQQKIAQASLFPILEFGSKRIPRSLLRGKRANA
jgi:hypothetical protein